MRKFRLNLRWKSFIVVSVGLLIAFGSVGLFHIYHMEKSFTGEGNRSGQERTALIADAVAHMIIAYDYANIEALAERIVKWQDVQKINIFNRDGKLLVTRNSRDFSDAKSDLEKLGAVFVVPVLISDVVVGSVELSVSRNRFDALIYASYRDIVIAIFVATIFFGFLIYSTVLVLVSKPLSRLIKAAKQLAIGNYSAELPPVTGDEIGYLVSTFSSMRESLKLNEVRLKAVFDHSPDAFVQLDSNGNIIDWNDKAEDIFGYRKSEVMGKNFSIVMPDNKHGLNSGYRSCYQKSENIIGVIREIIGQRKDGSLFSLELRTNEINLDEGSTYLVSARDITERRESESKLLSAMIAANAANAAKSDFLSNMSHEIRTPMNSIIGMTKLALKTHLNAKQHDYLVKIDYSAIHLLNLINDILDFSKIEARKLELEQIDFDLNSLFNSLSGQLAHSAASKQLLLVVDIDVRLTMPLRGDPMRLSQVLLNYTSNAIKFTEKGEITVRAKLLDERNDDVEIRFEVCDTGIGLSQDEISELFQPFQQADTSTTRKYGGTGLGLAICKQLVELMGGTVGVESQPGQGSVFWFVVRLHKGRELDVKTQAALVNFDALKNSSILLAEDNLFNQQVAVEMLQEVGARVSVANNGQEVIDMLMVQRFDIVLMDVQMPVMDGLEATRKIRSTPALADICIIAMTANARREDKEQCFAAGMDEFISKPVFADKLYSVLAQCLSGKAAGNVIKQSALPELDPRTHFVMENLRFQALASDHVALVDLSVLAKMLGSDPAKIHKFALKFLSSARLGLEEIEAAINQQNLPMIAALGHRNKSPARTVGALAYAELCQSLEQFKNGGEVESAIQIMGRMNVMLEKIALEIEAAVVQQK